MKKIAISQLELDQASGRFNEYMEYVTQRLAAKNVDPKIALFEAVTLIEKDGFRIQLGSYKDSAAISVSRWFDKFLGDRCNVSYCLPYVAYSINGIVHLLRMPIVRPQKIPLTEAVVDLTEQRARLISSSQMKSLAETYNEFYDALHSIARFDKTTVIHLETSAQYLVDGATLYAQSRWESLHFVEMAMKEVLNQEGVAVKGADGHNIKGTLHEAWLKAGKHPLPAELLQEAWCTAAMRYEKTPQPLEQTMRAHHAAIRLGATISQNLPGVPPMENELSIEPSALKRDAVLSIIRALAAIDTSPSAPIKLHR